MCTHDLIRQHIRSLREAAGLSQNDIASRLGIDPRNYARLERGERKQLDLQLLVAIARAMEVDLLALLEPILTEPSRSHPKPDPIENVIERHYENVIAQLMDIIESQKRIIEEKSKVIQRHSFPVLNERPNYNAVKDLSK